MSALRGKVALVTGASKGIGRELALRLAKDGASVGVAARSAALLEDLVTEMRGFGGNALALPLDVRDGPSVVRSIAQLESGFGGLDILVNNAGGAMRYAGFEDLAEQDWLNAFDLNVLSIVRFVRAALPALRRSSSGRVINISSLSALQPGSFNPHYSASKAAVVNLGKHLADALARDRVLVTTLCPGPIHSDAWDRNLENVAASRNMTLSEARDAVEAEESRKVPLGRIGEGKDLAGLVSFLASEEASWITGACFVVDGGKLRAIH